MEIKYKRDKIKEQLKLNNSNNKLIELKSDFFLKILFNLIMHKRISLKIIKYNKYIQKE